MSRTLVAFLTTLALAGTLVGASSSSAGATDDSEVPAARGAGYHQPKVGSCHVLTSREFNAKWAPTATVPCSKKHTTKTLVVKRLTGKVDWQRPDIFRSIWFPCMRKNQRVLGDNDRVRAMSAFSPSFFMPNPKERARGAKWLRCDIGLVGGRTMRALPHDLDLGRLPLGDRVARCLSGGERSLLVTVCAKRHTYRATGAFKLDTKTYPGEKRFVRAAHRRCPALTSSVRWRYQFPGHRDQWKAGYRSIVCYSQTRR